MVLRIEDQRLIREYLLGELTEDGREQFEKRMMTDSELFNQVAFTEDEMVEEYLRGGLSEQDRQAFEASFLSTVDGREQVTFTKSLKEYVASKTAEEPAAPVQLSSRPARKIAWWSQADYVSYARLAAAAVIIIGAAGIWRLFFYQSEVSKGIEALAYAYRDQRPLEARISGFGYAPAATTRGDEEKVDRVARNRAERILLDEVSDHPSAASHHALGRLYLAEQKFDDAIARFEEALKAAPNSAQLHNDYGAALLEKGKADKDQSGPSFDDLSNALEHFEQAVELDGSLLEAFFNRALVLEGIALTLRAQEAWRAYLNKDSASRWADEAREHLRELERLNIQKTSQSVDRIFEDFMIGFETGDDDKAWRALKISRNSQGNSIQNRLADDWLLSADASRVSGGSWPPSAQVHRSPGNR